MAITLVADVGSATANSYLTLAEAEAYHETRLRVNSWDSAESQEALLIQATRVMEAMFSPGKKTLIRPDPPAAPYFLTRPTWTGTVASSTQRLLWPRIGMYSRTGVAIPSNVIPQELKDAVAELAIQLSSSDRLLDNDVAVQGISSVRAGSVSVSFKNNIEIAKVIPEIVASFLVPSWLTEEVHEASNTALFNVVSN